MTGIIWSLAGGAVGAIGALGIIMALYFGGKPVYVMPLVFGGAPVVNSFLTIVWAKKLREVGPLFLAGLVMVVLGAVTVATAAVTPGTVAQRVAAVPAGPRKTFSVQHPSGEFTVVLEMDARKPDQVARASLLRTARLLMRGEVMIPGDIWKD